MPEHFTVTGLMSGTSLDGVDLACCAFSRGSAGWSFRILAAATFAYPPDLKARLGEAHGWGLDRIRELDLELGQYFAELIGRFHGQHDLKPMLVASHGHTILHNPGKGITFQAGDGRTMARMTGLTVVNDFRSEDVAQGGQGAPLVPVGDRLLFGAYDACLNLGGFANISYDDPAGSRIAYDICPANLALNHLAVRTGMEYDRDGLLAAAGSIIPGLLERLNGLDYYRLPPPKSLGREWFLEQFVPAVEAYEACISDRMATVVEHIASRVSASLERSGAGTVLATGGGSLNRTLADRIRKQSKARIHIPAKRLVQYKEALVFAFLGLLRYLGEVNCLSSVTGGRKDLSAGTIYK
jgi:anhydro-N-acetylmuramic acid kinase